LNFISSLCGISGLQQQRVPSVSFIGFKLAISSSSSLSLNPFSKNFAKIFPFFLISVLLKVLFVSALINFFYFINL